MEGFSRSLLLFLLLCLINTAHGEHAFTITASDLENDPLTFTLTGINAENFTVEENTGVVRVRRPLDRQASEMDLVVVVSDGSTPNTTVGSSLFTMKATDEDEGFAGVVKYSIDEVVPSSGSGLFTIDESSGEVRLTGGLNYTHLSHSYQLKINATDGGGKCYFTETTFLSSVAVASISIEDVPDLNPVFIGAPYKASVRDESPQDVPVIQVTAMDPDTGVNAEINYSIEDATIDGLFKISSEGVISVQSKIDREALATDTVNLTVKAAEAILNTDGVYASTTTSVVINIIDINDNPPRFYMCGSTCVEKSHYTVEVLENSLGSIPINMTVKDLDKDTKTNLTLGGADKDVFEVEPQFTVSEQAVQLTLIQKLDFEKTQKMIIEVIAIDHDDERLQSTATVTVQVKDINDNKPKFPESSYRFHVRENSPIGTVVAQIKATDADEPDTNNSRIVYRIETSGSSDLFTIDPDTGVLTNSGELDHETLDGRIEFNVTATDKGVPPLSATVPVIITVDDVNDNKPQFGEPSYEFSVKEGEKGAFVGSVTAEDLDKTADFNRISFTITDGSFDNFIISTYPMEQGYIGNITIDPDIELDRERWETFILRVKAADPDQKSAEVTVIVNVVDVNDERPEFRPIDPVSVKENTTIEGVVGRFVAHDKDKIHRLVYELESMTCRCGETMKPCSYFILLPTGEVALNHELTVDYEECDQVLIEAQVVDELTEKGENNSATTGKMVINIEDINDNAPEFIYSNAVYVVTSESASNGTYVASVIATDRDSGINAQIAFKVTEVRFTDSNRQTHNMRLLFEAVTKQQKENYVGTIQTTERLDGTLKGSYWVTLTAADTGGLSTTTVLQILTVDKVNEVYLKFSSSVEEVEEKLDDIIRVLRAATNVDIEFVSIIPASSRTGAIIIARFVKSDGTTLTADEVGEMVSDPEYSSELTDLGLIDVGDGSSEPDTTIAIVLGVVGVLVGLILVVVSAIVFIKKKKKKTKKEEKKGSDKRKVSAYSLDNL